MGACGTGFDGLSEEQIRVHYELERALTRRILAASPERRLQVMQAAYDELFRAIPWHPDNHRTPAAIAENRESYAPFLRLCGTGHDILEIGCGKGENLRVLARTNRLCVGLDISEEILDRSGERPGRLEFVVGDASDMSGLADAAFDVVFSKQLIEHLFPDRLMDHFREVARVLRPGGRYIYETPNRLDGPHDVSRFYDETATCFHLKEYTNGEILAMQRAAGFDRFRTPLFRQRMYERHPRLARACEWPADWKRLLEAVSAPWPRRWRRRLGRALIIFNVAYRASDPSR